MRLVCGRSMNNHCGSMKWHSNRKDVVGDTISQCPGDRPRSCDVFRLSHIAQRKTQPSSSIACISVDCIDRYRDVFCPEKHSRVLTLNDFPVVLYVVRSQAEFVLGGV